MYRTAIPATWLVCFCTAMLGCSASDELPDETVPTAAPVTPASPEIKESVKPVGDQSKSPNVAEGDVPTQRIAEFSPPFPERLELFEPPQRAQGAVSRDDELSETVELKGFINVDQPLAVLSIDGVMSSIPEGGEKYGVQVISIQPPSVIWQRGRNRRTATLE